MSMRAKNSVRRGGLRILLLALLAAVTLPATIAGLSAAPAGAADEWRIRIVSDDEPGTSVVVSGTIYARDGRTPLSGVFLEIHQTGIDGLYHEDENGEPRLKGRLRTDARGRYEFRTIKPEAYPSGGIPAHIHARVWGEGIPETAIDDYWFEGDKYLTAGMIARVEAEGDFSPVLSLANVEDGAVRCRRDIRLDIDPAP